MLNKNNSFDHNQSASSDEYKECAPKGNLSKFDFDLYKDEDNKKEPVIRIKRVSAPNKGEKWKVMDDNKVVFTIESTKISKKEREFLQTIVGFNFLLQQAKNGIKSLNSLKIEMKKIIGNNAEKEVKKSKKKKTAHKKK